MQTDNGRNLNKSLLVFILQMDDGSESHAVLKTKNTVRIHRRQVTQ